MRSHVKEKFEECRGINLIFVHNIVDDDGMAK